MQGADPIDPLLSSSAYDEDPALAGFASGYAC